MVSVNKFNWEIIYYTSIFAVLILMSMYIYLENGPSKLTTLYYILPLMGFLDLYVHKLINSKYTFGSANELALKSLIKNQPQGDLPEPDFGVNKQENEFKWLLGLGIVIWLIIFRKNIGSLINKYNLTLFVIFIIIIGIYKNKFDSITNNFVGINPALNAQNNVLDDNLFKAIAENETKVNCRLSPQFESKYKYSWDTSFPSDSNGLFNINQDSVWNGLQFIFNIKFNRSTMASYLAQPNSSIDNIQSITNFSATFPDGYSHTLDISDNTLNITIITNDAKRILIQLSVDNTNLEIIMFVSGVSLNVWNNLKISIKEYLLRIGNEVVAPAAPPAAPVAAPPAAPVAAP